MLKRAKFVISARLCESLQIKPLWRAKLRAKKGGRVSGAFDDIAANVAPVGLRPQLRRLRQPRGPERGEQETPR